MSVTLKKYFCASSPSVFGHYYLSPVSLINPEFDLQKDLRFFIALADFLQFSLGDRHFQRVDAAGFLLTDADAFHAADTFLCICLFWLFKRDCPGRTDFGAGAAESAHA